MKIQKPRIFDTSIATNQQSRLVNRSDISMIAIANITKDRSQEIYNNRRKNSTLLQNLLPNTYVQPNQVGRDQTPQSILQSNLVSKVSVKLVTRAEGTSNLKVNRINPALLPGCLKGNISSVSNYSTSPSMSSSSYRPMTFTRENQYNRSYKKSKSILQNIPNLANTLGQTKIVSFQRTKMVNWLVEVIANYPEFCDDHTLFRTIMLIDLYCKVPHRIPLENKDVCLIGICALFLASKYEDTNAIPLEEIRTTIGHSDYTADEILQKESDMLHALDFLISFPLPIDIFKMYANGCPNGLLEEHRDPLIFFGTSLLVMAAHDVRFNNFSIDTLAVSLLVFILKSVDLKIDKSFDFSYHSLVREDSLRNRRTEKEALSWLMSEHASRGQEIEVCVRELRAMVDYFDQLFPKCPNVKKYHNKYQIRFLDRAPL